MHIDELLDYRKFYPAGEDHDNFRKILCPYHKEDNPSFFIELKTGRFHCFGCGVKGNAFTFLRDHPELVNPLEKAKLEKHIQNQKAKQIEQTGKNEPKVNPATLQAIAENLHELLLNLPMQLKFLQETKGWTLETIKRFKIGFHKGRFTIPVYDLDGGVRNILKYKINPQGEEHKFLSWASGLGSSYLFPVENLKQSTILLTEGISDTILANQMGFPAICVTTGAGSLIPNMFLSEFVDKDIIILYDRDVAGKEGAVRVANQLARFGRVKICHLPENEANAKDFTDFVLLLGWGVEQFKTLIDNAPVYSIKDENILEFTEVTLDEATSIFHKGVIFKATISGKKLSPFILPTKIEFFCDISRGKECGFCPMSENDGKMILEIQKNNPVWLSLIDCNEATQHKLLRQMMGVPRCASLNVIEATPIEEVIIIPDFENRHKYIQRVGYYWGYGTDLNKTYKWKGLVVPHPATQQAVIILLEKEMLQDTLEKTYQFTEEEYNDLIEEIFAVKKDQRKLFTTCRDFEVRLNVLLNDLAQYTGIVGRPILHLGMLLVFFSPIYLEFDGEEITRSWIEALIIGDSRCGKSKVCEKLVEYYGFGEIASGDAASFAGLVGGIDVVGKSFVITWGAWPLNHERLHVIDELHEVNEDVICRLSAVRSTGIAQIVKIHRGEAPARVRKIFLANPKRGGFLSNYPFGVQSILGIFPKMEDIARLDYAIGVRQDDVDATQINTSRFFHECWFKQKTQRALLKWWWSFSNKRRNILFTKRAKELIYKYAIQMGETYSPTIPLVQISEQRHKLAKVAVAISAMFYQVKYHKLIVDAGAVEFAYKFFSTIYSDPALGYLQMSKLEKLRETINEVEVIPVLNTNIAKQLLTSKVRAFTKAQLTDIFGDNINTALRILTIENPCFQLTTHGYVLTEGFIKILERYIAQKIFEPVPTLSFTQRRDKNANQ